MLSALIPSKFMAAKLIYRNQIIHEYNVVDTLLTDLCICPGLVLIHGSILWFTMTLERNYIFYVHNNRVDDN